MTHHPMCDADYPEKLPNEKPQQISREWVDGFFIDTCVDCGATVDNMPPENDPYWDDVKENL